MPKLVLVNVRAFAGATDLTADTNKVEISADVDAVNVTNYGSAGWTELLGGIAATDIAVTGFYEAGADDSFVDPSSFNRLGGVGPWSVGVSGVANAGDLAWLTNALQATYKLGGTVGDAAPFEATAMGSTKLIRGAVLHPAGTARTTTGTGTAVQLGAVPAGKKLYANLHVLSVAGTATPTITVRIESDNAVGFPSPVTVLTFAAATAIGGQHANVAGPLTDDWFRAAWTISGTSPSFLFLVTAGIA